MAEDLAAAANARGSALMTAAHPIEALAEFRRVQRLLPDRIEGFVNEAIVYAHQGSPGCMLLAKERFEAVLKRDPRQPHTLYGLALLARDDDPGDRPEAMLEYARRFHEIVPGDPFGAYLVGLGLMKVDRREEALPHFRRSIELDAEFAPGHYNVARLLRQLNPADPKAAAEAAEHEEKTQRLNDLGKSVRFWTNLYTEHGAYARAMPLFGFGDTAQIAHSDAPVTLHDVTQECGISDEGASGRIPEGSLGLVWFTPQMSSDELHLLAPGGFAGGQARPTRLWRLQRLPAAVRPPRVRFVDITSDAGLDAVSGMTAAVAADWDRDGDTDLLLTSPQSSHLMMNTEGRFVEAAPVAGSSLPGAAGQPSLEDFDHDGDEDLYLPGVSAGAGGGVSNAVYRNLSLRPPSMTTTAPATQTQTPNRFDDASQTWAIGTNLPGAVGVLWTDYDLDLDTDAIVCGDFSPGLAVFENKREAGFAVADPKVLNAWLAAAGNGTAGSTGELRGATLGDLDNNGQPDLIITRTSPPVLNVLLSQERRFIPDDKLGSALPAGWQSASGAAAVDIDNDGDLDLLVLVAGAKEADPQLALLTNDGLGRFAFNAASGSWKLPAPGRVIAPADIDRDGRMDLAIRLSDGALRIFHNRTDNPFTGRSIRLRRSSPSDVIWKFSCPIGAKVRVQSGRFAQFRRTATSTGYFAQAEPYVHVGLGDREKTRPSNPVDGIEILWPSGAIQGVTPRPLPSGVISIHEVDVRPASCPFLFVWDGKQYRFLADTLAASPPGLYLAPGVYALCDTDEYLRVPEGMLAPKDGSYEVIVHECLREITFLDQAQLIAVDHPSELAVYPDERFTGPPPFPGFRLLAFEKLLAPGRAVDHRGVDCLAELTHPDDGKNVHAFGHSDVAGFAEEHAIELEFDDVPADSKLALLLHGYLKFPGSASQYVAAERGLKFQMPRLDLLQPDGSWKTLIDNIGAPAGFTRTMTVDLSGKLPPGQCRLRITTNILTYWDWARLGVIHSDAPLQLTRLAPDAAELSRVGFPRVVPQTDPGRPESYDYNQLSPIDDSVLTSRWPNMVGLYTRFGDVKELMQEPDDRYAIFAAGEQVRLSFAARHLPPLRVGMTRTFLVYVDGWVKDNYHQTATSATVGPLPFHGMPNYPDPARSQFPWDESRRAWDRDWNTRAILDAGAF